MTVNVWISQPTALKAEVEAIKLEASPVAELAVEGKIKEEAAKIVPVEIKGTAKEKADYVRLASKIADKVDGLFKSPTIKAQAMTLESLYLDSVDDIEKLVKGGATILGAWDWNGTQVEGYPPHKDLIQYMPIRKTYDDEGNETGELEPVLEDSVLCWGQSPRQFA